MKREHVIEISEMTLRDGFNKERNYSELQDALKTFTRQFEMAAEPEKEEEPEGKSYAPEDLELVCYLTLS